MAKFDGKYLRGMAGPVTNREYRGMQLVQSNPVFGPSSQTEGTKTASGIFGQASTLACSIRDNLEPFINGFYPGPMITDLNTEVLYCLRNCINESGTAYAPSHNSFNKLDGFEFNANSLVINHLLTDPDLSLQGNILSVNLPDIYKTDAIQFPKTAKGCYVHVGFGFHDLQHKKMTLSPVQSIKISKAELSGVDLSAHFDFEVQPGCLCIAVISLEFYKTTLSGELSLNSKTMNPVMILAAFMAEGNTNPDITKKWSQDMKFKLEIKNKF
ncbi:hypothetical protein [Pedobacter sp. GR22-6]|uniref:hypothetical protein n=1 Tax=Pedobacter sp. GR22-6 TaxID=3127957 RepID=UPI00307D0597